MWTCPACGRRFKHENQSHYCGKAPETIDEYIAAQPEEIQPYLTQVRNALRAVLPDAEERISWHMPTFRRQHNIIHFAAHQKHLGLYAGPEAVKQFEKELAPYPTSKGSMRFPYKEPLPLDLMTRIAVWCYETGNHP